MVARRGRYPHRCSESATCPSWVETERARDPAWSHRGAGRPSCLAAMQSHRPGRTSLRNHAARSDRHRRGEATQPSADWLAEAASVQTSAVLAESLPHRSLEVRQLLRWLSGSDHVAAYMPRVRHPVATGLERSVFAFCLLPSASCISIEVSGLLTAGRRRRRSVRVRGEGVRMGLETGDDSAILQTIVIVRP